MILVQATVAIPAAILGEAVLSFLGLGIQPPAPSLGTMLSDAQQFAARAPWAAVLPGLAIMLLTLAFNVVRRQPARRTRPEGEPPMTTRPAADDTVADGRRSSTSADLSVTFATETGTVSAVDRVEPGASAPARSSASSASPAAARASPR